MTFASVGTLLVVVVVVIRTCIMVSYSLSNDFPNGLIKWRICFGTESVIIKTKATKCSAPLVGEIKKYN